MKRTEGWTDGRSAGWTLATSRGRRRPPPPVLPSRARAPRQTDGGRMTINYYAGCGGYRFLLLLLLVHRNREDDALSLCPSVRPLPFVGIPIPRPFGT